MSNELKDWLWDNEEEKRRTGLRAFTDYPFTSLGDTVGELAPIRECIVLDWDGDKYCRILIEGLTEYVKLGYLYQQEGRLGEVRCIDRSEIPGEVCTQ
jgi:hypothetical protein